MAKAKKSTKKFNKNHLKSEIEKRKKLKKFKSSEGKTAVVEKRVKNASVSTTQPNVEQKKDANAISEHRKQLEALADQDPEFYQFLKENDTELLDFGMDLPESGDEQKDEEDLEVASHLEQDTEDMSVEDLEEESANEEVEGEEEPDFEMCEDEADEDEFSTDESEGLTMERIEQLRDSLTNKNLKAVKEVLQVFRMTIEAAEEGDEMVVSDETVMSELVKLLVREVPSVLCHHLRIQRDRPIKLPAANASSTKWKKCAPLTKSYLLCIKALLSQVTEAEMQDFIFRELDASNAAALFACCGVNKNVKDFLKHVIYIATVVNMGRDDSEQTDVIREDRQLRTMAMIVLKQWFMHGETEFRNLCLKHLYKAFLSAGKNTTPYTLPSIRFLSETMVEIFSLYPMIAYQHAFVGIRQIAMLLRNALTQPSQEANQALLNWSNVHALRFWSSFLVKSAPFEDQKQSPLSQLFFPLCQVSLGVARSAPAKTCAPLQIHILESLVQLCGPNQLQMPTAASLLVLLEHLVTQVMSGGNSGTKTKPIVLDSTLKLSSSYPCTPSHYMPMIERVMALLERQLSAWARFIAFPEWSLGLMVFMRRIKKLMDKGFTLAGDSHKKVNGKSLDGTKKRLNALIQASEENIKWIKKHRAHVAHGPMEVAKTRKFLMDCDEVSPLEKYAQAMARVHQKQI